MGHQQTIEMMLGIDGLLQSFIAAASPEERLKGLTLISTPSNHPPSPAPANKAPPP